MILKITAEEVREGDSIPGLDNGYVCREPQRNKGWLSYPVPDGGQQVGMPSDTIVITFHDADGEECYLLLPAESRLEVSRITEEGVY